MITENFKIDSYRVPVVLHTLDILEILRDASRPLSAREISAITETSRSTVYRILKTLAWRGYVSQRAYGKFSLASTTWSRLDPTSREFDLISKMRDLFESSRLSRYEIAEVLLEVMQPAALPSPGRKNPPNSDHERGNKRTQGTKNKLASSNSTVL